MLMKYLSLAALALALGGCVAAVPLAQMAVSQAAPKPPCVAGPACATAVPTGSFADMSKGMTDGFHRLTGGSDAALPAK